MDNYSLCGRCHNNPLERSSAPDGSSLAKHIYYSSPRFHITLLSLGKPVELKPYLNKIVELCLEAVTGFEDIEVRVVGLNVLGNSVIAQVIDSTGQLKALVIRCINLLRHQKINLIAADGFHSKVSWITLARLLKYAEPDLKRFINKHRSFYFTKMTIGRIKLVETDKLFDLNRTMTLELISFEH